MNKELLEYISILEEQYIPDFDYDTDSPYFYGYEKINKSKVNAEDWEEICNQSTHADISETLQIFESRYNKGLITESFNYASFIKHDLIQKFIKELDLDINKFWMLLLFVYDYSYHYYMEGTDMGESPNEQLLKFTKTIILNAENFDEKKGTTFTKPLTLKICVEGERDIIIAQLYTLLYQRFCIIKVLWHYKIFCVNRNTGFRKESRIFYFIHLQNEEDYERKESSSA